MKKIIFAFFIGFLFFNLNLKAQENPPKYDDYYNQLKKQFKKESAWYRTWNRYEVNPGFSKYSIGLAKIFPLNNYSNVKDAWGIRYRNSHLEAGGAFWKGVQKENSNQEKNYARLSLGYFTPVNLFSIGKRYLDVKGFLLQGTASLGYTNTAGNHGIYFAPGLDFQLPFSLISTRANLEYTFGNGFNIFPEISIQLDALRSLLDPHKVKTGSTTHSYTTATPLGGGWYKISSNTEINDFYLNDIGPFWGITPRYGFALSEWANQPYNTFGLGISGRYNFLGAEIRMDFGKLQTGISKSNEVNFKIKNDFDETKIKGIVNTNEITFEANVNLVGLILGIVKPGAFQNMSNRTTPLNRLNFHLGVTRFSPQKVVYENFESATAYTNQFFNNHPEIERNAINDPLTHEKGWGISYGISYEMGAIGLRVNNKLQKTIGNGTTIDVYYIIPITKVAKAYQN